MKIREGRWPVGPAGVNLQHLGQFQHVSFFGFFKHFCFFQATTSTNPRTWVLQNKQFCWHAVLSYDGRCLVCEVSSVEIDHSTASILVCAIELQTVMFISVTVQGFVSEQQSGVEQSALR